MHSRDHTKQRKHLLSDLTEPGAMPHSPVPAIGKGAQHCCYHCAEAEDSAQASLLALLNYTPKMLNLWYVSHALKKLF